MITLKSNISVFIHLFLPGGITNKTLSRIRIWPCPVWLSCWEPFVYQEVEVEFLIKAHAWVAGPVPRSGHARGSSLMLSSCIDVSLSPTPLLSLKKKIYFKKRRIWHEDIKLWRKWIENTGLRRTFYLSSFCNGCWYQIFIILKFHCKLF